MTFKKLLMKKYSRRVVNLISCILLISMVTLITPNISKAFTTIMITICINVLVAVSLNISAGSMGEVVLGQAGFMAIGAYSSGLFCKYVPMNNMFLEYLICIVVAAVIAGLVGFVVGIPCLRLRGDYLAIVTLGFGEAIRCLIENLDKITGGPSGLTSLPRLLNSSNRALGGYGAVLIAITTTVVCVGCIYSFMTSRYGRAILSIREDAIAAEAAGIPVTRYKVMAFTISAMFAGIGGAMFAHTIGSIYPSNFNLSKSIDYLVMVVFGGLGSYTGSILSATILSYLTIRLTNLAAWRLVIYSLALILVMIFHPKGLFGIKEFSMTNAILIVPGKIKLLFTKAQDAKNNKKETIIETEEVEESENNKMEAEDEEAKEAKALEEDNMNNGGKSDGE